LVCRYHYFRGTCCFLCVHTSWQQCCMKACLILQKWKPSCCSNSSKYETIIVLRVFLVGWRRGGVCRQSKYKGFCVLKLRITKKHVVSAAPFSYFGGFIEMWMLPVWFSSASVSWWLSLALHFIEVWVLSIQWRD